MAVLASGSDVSTSVSVLGLPVASGVYLIICLKNF